MCSIRRCLLVLGVATVLFGGCGGADESNDATSDDPVATDAAAGSSDTGSGSVDPCQWYTAEEMEALVGFAVTAEELETPQGLGAECLYDSTDQATGITVRPITATTYDELKAAAAAAGLGGAQIDFPGVGDEAYHNGAPDNPNPSVAFSAKKGDAGIQVELATASSGAVTTVDQAVAITSAIATTALT